MGEAQQVESTAAAGRSAADLYGRTVASPLDQVARGAASADRLSADAQHTVVRPTGHVAVLCESTSCLPLDLVRQYGITTIPIPFAFGDDTFLDGVDITPDEFYARLKATRMPPRTSPPSPGEYLERWTALTGDGTAALLVTASGTITSFSRSTRLAQDLARDSLPQAQIAVVDSGSAAMGQGFVTLAAARAAARGADLAEAVAAAEHVRDRVEMIVTLDTLEYLARASRIPQVAAWVGGMLAIKPVILFARGDVHQLARVRTRRRSVEQLMAELRARVVPGSRVHVAIHHTQAEGEAIALREQVATEFACVEMYLTEFTAVMGAYCGPGLLGVAYYVEDGEQ